MITPLIKQINRNSLITFPTSLEDFNVSGHSSDRKKVYFSHFALLDLPDISVPVGDENVIDFERMEHYFVNGKNIGANGVGDRIDLSENLQNFALNYEALLSEQEWYNKSSLSNCSERIFFKWLKEIGAIRYSNTNLSFADGNRFKEEDESSRYSRVIQYISKIGVNGKVIGKKNAFNEVYINIPSNVGRTPNVFVKSVSDKNYGEGTVVTRLDGDPEFINGFSAGSPAPSNGLSLTAHYNKDVGNVEYTSTDENGDDKPNWSDYYSGLDCYMNDSAFENPSNDIITMTLGNKTKTFLRSNLDGVQIDFDINSYKSPEQTNINTLEDLNNNLSSRSFRFNAILLYYTVVDETTGQSATNLYGVAFVGDVVQRSAGVSNIDRKDKIKSDNIIGNVGNGYGYRFNFKLDSRQQEVNPHIEIDEYITNSFSMAMFSETMLKMGEILERYEKSQELNTMLIERNASYLDLLSQISPADLKFEIDSLRTLIESNNISDINGSQIESLYKKIDEILSGRTSISVDLITKFVGENGIDFMYTKENDTLKVTNKVSDYGETEVLNLSTIFGNVNAVKISGLKKIVCFTGSDTLNDTINVLINDSIQWNNGQSLTLTFDTQLVGNAKLKVYTDVNKKMTQQEYGLLILDSLVEAGNSFDIICVKSDILKFVVQKTQII